MTKHVTDDQAQTMIQTGKAVRHGHTLVTRTTMYDWSDNDTAYVPTHTGLRIEHTHDKHLKKGYQWDGKDKRFYACACTKCL